MGTTPSNTLDLSVSDPSGHEYNVAFESDYFAQGQHRQCYVGTLINDKAPKHNKKYVKPPHSMKVSIFSPLHSSP